MLILCLAALLVPVALPAVLMGKDPESRRRLATLRRLAAETPAPQDFRELDTSSIMKTTRGGYSVYYSSPARPGRFEA